MSNITDKIFQGTWLEARSRVYQKTNDITHIQITSPEVEPYFKNAYCYKTVPLCDLDTFDIGPFLDIAADFIKKGQEEGSGLLIHDFRNDSRSTVCLIAYMIKYQGFRFGAAFRYILARKPETKIRKKFGQVLKDWESVLEQRAYDERKKNGNTTDQVDSTFRATSINKGKSGGNLNIDTELPDGLDDEEDFNLMVTI